MKGYKVFDPDLSCRGFQFEVGKTYGEEGKLVLSENGFHFCEQAQDCFNYHSFDSSNRVCEVEALGEVVTKGDKSVTNKIKIIRELSWEEVLRHVNTGKGNSGLANSGDSNSGNYNSGSRNSGSYNSGSRNSGYWNSGSYNSGSHNSGNYNSGSRNSGYWNSGDYNSGRYNSGNYNSGRYNSGNYNSGSRNSGYWNSGSYNSGSHNSGNYNSGSRNSGYWNSGYYNSGDYNSGDYNSGRYNSGRYNSGAFNACNYSSGFFNTVTGKVPVFNGKKLVDREEFLNSPGYRVLVNHNLTLNKFVDISEMTEEEKKQNPDYETLDGYLKQYTYQEAWANLWKKLTEEEKTYVYELPGFDWEVFTELTGIKEPTKGK